MRGRGFVDSARGLVPHGHVCWAFASRGEYLARAREYITDALAAGQWVEYVGAGSRAELRGELAGLLGRPVVASDGIGVSSVEEFYAFAGGSQSVDPAVAVAARVAGTERALAAGYPGFRAVVDCTAVARTAEQRAAFARFEYLIDHQMSRLPVSAFCAYDIGELGAPAVAELACLHPYANTGSTLFRLYAEPGIECAVAGEVDFSCAELFATALNRTVADPVGQGPEVVVDGAGLDFIDHRGILALAAAGQRAGRPLILSTAGASAPARLVEILDTPELRVREAG